MPRSILTAIEEGYWDYEPNDVAKEEYHSTEALPGSEEKLKLLAQRVYDGLPLWHPADRQSIDDEETAYD